ALLNFKRCLKPLLLPSWKGNGDCCEWEGIACDNFTGHVVMLDLNDPCLYFFSSYFFTDSNLKPLMSDADADDHICPH
ncbi:hypothetical protein HN51_031339, partial [Arachis hypogaea]